MLELTLVRWFNRSVLHKSLHHHSVIPTLSSLVCSGRTLLQWQTDEPKLFTDRCSIPSPLLLPIKQPTVIECYVRIMDGTVALKFRSGVFFQGHLRTLIGDLSPWKPPVQALKEGMCIFQTQAKSTASMCMSSIELPQPCSGWLVNPAVSDTALQLAPATGILDCKREQTWVIAGLEAYSACQVSQQSTRALLHCYV